MTRACEQPRAWETTLPSVFGHFTEITCSPSSHQCGDGSTKTVKRVGHTYISMVGNLALPMSYQYQGQSISHKWYTVFRHRSCLPNLEKLLFTVKRMLAVGRVFLKDDFHRDHLNIDKQRYRQFKWLTIINNLYLNTTLENPHTTQNYSTDFHGWQCEKLKCLK